jgi:hypothetical protein
MIKTSLSFLANHPLPVEVGTITVSPDGTPHRHAPAALAFSFDYTGAAFAAQVEPIEGGARLRLDAVLAAMPYTAEDRQRRRDVQLIMRASRAGLSHGRLVLDAQRRIHLVSELAIGSPVTPAALVATATRLLIAATPWLALLRQHLGPTAPPPPDPTAAPLSARPA